MNQMDLIEPLDAASRSTARRDAMDAAKRRADRAIRAVGDKAGDDWCMRACDALRIFARAQGGVFTVEIARLALTASKAIELPTDGRAWGRAARMALARGYIERVPKVFFPAASSNGSPKPVYRSGAA